MTATVAYMPGFTPAGAVVHAFTAWTGDAWIAPNGDLHFVPMFGHCDVAYALGDETCGQVLEMTYVHVSGGLIDAPTVARMTDAQEGALYDVAAAMRAHDAPLQGAMTAQYCDSLAGLMDEVYQRA
jgi:hypothetical protein